MSWQLLMLISITAFSLSTIAQKKLATKNLDSITLAIGFQLIVSILLAVVVVVRGFDYSGNSNLIIHFVIMVALYSAVNIAKFKSLKKIEASEFTILFPFSAITSVLAATIFLSESFNITQGLGLVLIILAIIIVSWSPGMGLRFGSGEAWAIASSGLLGLAFVNDAYILRDFDTFSYTFLAFLLPTLAISIIYPKKLTALPALFNRRNVVPLLLAGFFYGIAATSIYLAYQVGRNAAQLQSLNQLTIIVTVILSIVILKERSRLSLKILAALLGMIGAIFLV